MSEYMLGESEGETARLRLQNANDDVEARLRWAGIKPGMRVLDAGCGPGEVARTIARLVGPAGSVHGYDSSPVRIAAAKAMAPAADLAPISFDVGDIHTLPWPPGTADMVVCQYVLEYLPRPAKAVEALAGYVKPGGIVLLMDCDGIGLIQWPSPKVVEDGLPGLMSVLGNTGFDPCVGRKLYSLAYMAGLKDLQVTTYAPMIAGGPVKEEEYVAWQQRFSALAPLGIQAFGSSEAWNLFTAGYLDMLRDRSSFKLVLGVAVKGVR